MVTERTCDAVIVSNSVRHVIERDGWNLLKKSLYVQNPYVYVRIKSLTRKDVLRTHKVASSAQVVYVRNKSLTRTSRDIRTH